MTAAKSNCKCNSDGWFSGRRLEVELLVVIAIIGILVALLLPAVQTARRMECSNKLKQIGLAILNYETNSGTFPTSVAHYDEGGVEGTGYGWSVGILPYLEQHSLYDSLNYTGQAYPAGSGAFNGQNNEYIKTPLDVYPCPSDSPRQLVKTNVWRAVPAGLPLAVTSYAGSIGSHDMGNASIVGGESDCHDYQAYGEANCRGALWHHSIVAPADMKSGTRWREYRIYSKLGIPASGNCLNERLHPSLVQASSPLGRR